MSYSARAEGLGKYENHYDAVEITNRVIQNWKKLLKDVMSIKCIRLIDSMLQRREDFINAKGRMTKYWFGIPTNLLIFLF